MNFSDCASEQCRERVYVCVTVSVCVFCNACMSHARTRALKWPEEGHDVSRGNVEKSLPGRSSRVQSLKKGGGGQKKEKTLVFSPLLKINLWVLVKDINQGEKW